ncbi:ATP-dependent DNA helicase RecG [Bremerella volcania]|uniref:ATP-dependent DNA helicase RecG n=1 Tax=Bremerella volcania TaxID=2527984 RepID=A0A518C5B6_9BACT|nr:ATP-dependent DNA helicase RecG [Bremerella volcania]QDU74384.1 ATP-dependent DNA helicase RecG [Bremerella volcania]
MSDSRASTPLQRLRTPVQFLKGVGPQRAERLAKLQLYTALDLIFFFPRDYQDLLEIVPADDLKEDEPASITGVIEDVDFRGTGPGRSVLGVLVRDNQSYVRGVWFNQCFLRKRFQVGQHVIVSGRPRLQGNRWEMAHPVVDIVEPGEHPEGGKLLPIYPLTEGIRQGLMRKMVHTALDTHGSDLEEVLPDSFLKQHELLSVHDALNKIHRPHSREEMEAARKRFIYQELLVLQLAMSLRKHQLNERKSALPIPVDFRIDERIRKLLPFELTEDQNKAIHEICHDLNRTIPMNRLLQGDVGTGKTMVSVYAMLAAVAAKTQAALMAPTEVLAKQHARTLSKLLSHAKVRIGVLTGSLTEKERAKLLADVAAGEIDLLIGTQAIIATEITFQKLGLVIIDEQHKFGVRQRAALRSAGNDPHYLVMTATPIPRTVALGMFGDLDISTIRNAPPGRQSVSTYIAEDEQRAKWWDFFRKKLREGRQGYVIAPLVDETNRDDTLGGVEQLLEHLANGELEEFRLEMLHGRMPPAEKDAVMQRFANHEIDVLIATTVVEVGVDVANAVLMTIESGERFGLAQLHQLRGRISRGKHPGYLCVFANPATDASRERLEAFAGTTDGFELAEVDFKLRGPGDLFGWKQHGMPPLRIADLQRDGELLAKAREDAFSITDSDPNLAGAKWEKLQRMVMIRYGKSLEIGDLG